MSRVTISFTEQLVRELDVDGTDVVVKTADVGQILQLIAHTEPLHTELAAAPAALVVAFEVGFELLDDAEKISLTSWLWGVVARHTKAVRSIVAVCACQPEEFVNKLLPDRLIALLLLSLEVNFDFFTQMLQQLRALAQSLVLPGIAAPAQPAAPSTGLQPSSSS